MLQFEIFYNRNFDEYLWDAGKEIIKKLNQEEAFSGRKLQVSYWLVPGQGTAGLEKIYAHPPSTPRQPELSLDISINPI